MFNTKINNIYRICNGIEIFGDYKAAIGFTADEGQQIQISVGGWCYKDFTFSQDSFSGTPLNYTEGLSGATYGCLTAHSENDSQIGITATIPAQYSEAGTRVALFISGGGQPGEEYINFGIKTYNPDLEHWATGQTPFWEFDMSNNNTDNFYSIGLPGTNPPGAVQWLWSRFDEMITRCNTIRGAMGSDYIGTYCNITQIATNVPIFDTEAHAMAYLEDTTDSTLTGILNYGLDPEEEYEKERNYRYINNVYGHNANNMTQYTGYRNYRFYGGDGKICLVRQPATAGNPYNLKLYHYQSYTVKSAGVYDTDDDDYTTISSPELNYLNKSIQFSSSDYYKVFKWLTDLLIFSSEAQADLWIADVIDARQAENYNEVSRVYDDIIDPGYGNPDPGYDNGINGQSYVHGARLWVLDSGQLNAFFDDIFDPLNIQTLLDGTKLFGSNEIGAIQGITYFPLDIEDVARVNGTAQAIKIGSFTCPTATGRYVWNNNKLLDCGKVFIAPVYNDLRDYRMKLFIQLPYVGTHELNISKFLNHYLEVFYAVDITTGGCTAHVLADGISYGDSFDGFMASQRPLTALDQTAYLNSVMGCVSSMVNRETSMISTAKNAFAGVATGNAKQVAQSSDIGGINTSMGAISDLYGLSQAVKDVPMSTRGGFAGCLGFFGNQQIHIITVQSKTVKPSLEQQIVGYPSHVSQRIGNFSGFLKTSAINLNNFSGTAQELEDIHNALAKGIYI